MIQNGHEAFCEKVLNEKSVSFNVRYKNEMWNLCRPQMNGSVHYRPTFYLPASAFRLHTKLKKSLKMLPKTSLLFIVDPLDYSINTLQFLRTLGYLTLQKKKTDGRCSSGVFREKCINNIFVDIFAKEVAPLYATLYLFLA